MWQCGATYLVSALTHSRLESNVYSLHALGFSQGGGVGLALANWITTGDPGSDIFGMDVARYGPYASGDRYLRTTTEQFYARRFILTHPNEELPAGRPLKTSPVYGEMKELGARFGATFGMEFPQYFALDEPDYVEAPTQRRSTAEKFVAQEVYATRTAAGLWETAIYGRYEVSGPGAASWLNRLLASKLPGIGRVRLATMLKPNGQLKGDLTVMRLAEDRFWLVGSYYLQAWHTRWFDSHLPAKNGSSDSDVQIRNISDQYMGFSLSGPKSRDILFVLTPTYRTRFSPLWPQRLLMLG
jgi:dimethylglycine dehydrogenase